MKRTFVRAQFIFMMLFACEVYGQERFETVNKRAQPFELFILTAANRHNVDPNLLWTIAYLESRFRPYAISYKDGRPCAFGLMQFTPMTARRFFGAGCCAEACRMAGASIAAANKKSRRFMLPPT